MLMGSVPLQCYEPVKAQKTLGVHVAMNGSWQKHEEVFLAKARTFTNQLQTGNLDCKETWCAFTALFVKKLEHPMPALSLSLKDWDKILKPVLGPLFKKLGMVWNWTIFLFPKNPWIGHQTPALLVAHFVA